MANLKIENLNKIYPNMFQAVFDFNLEIKDKDFVVFVGPSGCGKSTTLRMIAGLEDITSGKIFIDDELVNFSEPKDRNIAMVFQSYALYPNMNVFDNLSFGLKMRKKRIPLLDKTDENYPLYLSCVDEYNSLVKKKRSMKRKANDTKDIDNEIFNKEIELYNIQQRIKPIMSIDERKVHSLEKELKSAHNSITRYEKAIEEMKEKSSSLKKEDKKYERKKQLYTDGIALYEKRITATNDLIALDEKKLKYYTETKLVQYKYVRYSKEEITRKVHEVSRILEIEEYLARKPSTLSGGQRQRVAIGRAIIRNPKVFLMDEPLSNLDAKLRIQMRQEIVKIHNQIGATTIYVTHDQSEAMTMATKIVVMKDGHMMQVGTPQEIFKHPLNQFVAGFIGTPQMNFLSVVVNDSSLSILNREIDLDEKQKSVLKDYVGKEITLGIRPDDIIFNENGQFEAKVQMIELVGCDKIVYLDMDGTKLVLKVKNYVEVEKDNTIHFDFNKDKMYFFDKDSQLALY